MTNPEFGKKNEFVRQKSTKWNNISDDIIFQQSELKVAADSASERSIEQAKSQVIEAFSKAQPESIDNQAEKERGFAQKVGEIDHRLGKLLGYPETAINQDFREPTKLLDKIKGLFKKRHDESFNSRCYVHSPGHENEEFEQYEKPIHEFMDKYCPESTKVLKDMKNSKGRSYRW